MNQGWLGARNRGESPRVHECKCIAAGRCLLAKDQEAILVAVRMAYTEVAERHCDKQKGRFLLQLHLLQGLLLQLPPSLRQWCRFPVWLFRLH